MKTIEELTEMKWISVKEELPKEEGWVKAKDINGNVVKRYYNPVQTIRFPQGFSYIIDGVLSWRDDNIVEWLKEIHND